jgi:ribosomal protein S12 methylthiotransferase
MANTEKIYFVSLGCPKNRVDTEIMLGVSRDEGYELVAEPDQADTLVVNTCGFIGPAKEESIDTILEMARIKANADSRKRLVVTGCLSQRHPDELASEMPEVDHFLGSADMLGLRDVLRGKGKRLAVSKLDRRAYLYDHDTPRRTYGAAHTQYVKIAEGCDRPCAFCIIPKLRGPQRSREIPSLVREAEGLVEAGARELALIAQDLTTYGSDMEARGLEAANLEQLIDALGEISGLRWIRLHYAYPTTTTPGLIERIAQHAKVASYLDVPLQHVDTDVLKRMRRGYGERAVRELVDRIRAADEHIWLRTTMLVGHPGEDQAAFERLRSFIGEGQIDHLGVFPWSREDGTAAAMLPSRVSEEVAEARAAELMELQAGLRADAHRGLHGQILDVMVDGPSDESEFLLDGRHEGQAREIDGKVVLCDGSEEPGELVRARVIQSTAHDLVCTMDLDRELDPLEGDEAF